MLHIGTNQIALGLFLLLNLIIGLWTGRNVKTMKDYALANRSLGTGVLAMTLIATFIGIEHIQRIDISKQFGLIHFISFTIALVLSPLCLAYFVFPELQHFADCYTIGEIMHKLYGSFARYFTVLLSIVIAIFTISGQFIAISSLHPLFGISQGNMILFIGSFLILYSFLGGVRSVTATDVVQFLFCVAGFVLLAHFLLYKAKLSLRSLFTTTYKLYPDRFTIWNNPGFKPRIAAALFWGGISNRFYSSSDHSACSYGLKQKVFTAYVPVSCIFLSYFSFYHFDHRIQPSSST